MTHTSINRLYNKIYCNNKKVNASVVDIDKVVDTKELCLIEDDMTKLFKAKCKDLMIPAFPV
jgi:hypothetical protein